MFQGPTARVLTGAAAAVAGLALATPAWAASGASLNPSHEGSTAANFQQECTDKRMAGRQAEQDGWHFVLPGGPSAGDFASLSLTFNDGVSDVYIAILDPHDAYPDAFYEAGGRQIHAYLFTPAGWTLKDGKAKVTKLNVDNNIKTATRFNVRSIPAILFFKNGKLVDQVIAKRP